MTRFWSSLVAYLARWANTFCPGYDMPVSDKIEIIFDHTGPTSYTNTGVFSTSGETVNASDLGVGGIEMLLPNTATGDGLYFVRVVPNVQSATSGVIGNPTVHWYVLSSGAEVANGTNLSASAIRFWARCV